MYLGTGDRLNLHIPVACPAQMIAPHLDIALSIKFRGMLVLASNHVASLSETRWCHFISANGGGHSFLRVGCWSAKPLMISNITRIYKSCPDSSKRLDASHHLLALINHTRDTHLGSSS